MVFLDCCLPRANDANISSDTSSLSSPRHHLDEIRSFQMRLIIVSGFTRVHVRLKGEKAMQSFFHVLVFLSCHCLQINLQIVFKMFVVTQI